MRHCSPRSGPDAGRGLEEVNGGEAELLKHQLRELLALLRERKRLLHDQQRVFRRLVPQSGRDSVVQELFERIVVCDYAVMSNAIHALFPFAREGKTSIWSRLVFKSCVPR